MSMTDFFSASYYLQQNADVAANWAGSPLDHYIQYGAAEGRAPVAWFDYQYYRATYADLQNLTALQLFEHYCNFGYAEGRVPDSAYANFDADRYLSDYSDLSAAGITTSTALNHYLMFGASEGRTAYNTAGDVISGGVASTFTLTDQTDNLSGTSANDTFIGDNITTSAGDTLDGGGGIDTLKIYSTSIVPNISNIEHLYYDSPFGNIDISAKSSVTAIEIDSFGNNTLTVDTGQDITLTDQAGGSIATIAGDDPTSLNITLDDAGSSSSDANIDIAGTGVTTLNITTSNDGSYVNITNTGGALTTINISGDQDISLQHALTTVTTIDASSNTGDTTIDGVGASDLTFTGGTGDDKIDISGTLNGNDTLDGGDGTDTLAATSADLTTANVAHVSNFETFEATGTGTYNLSVLNTNNSITGLIIDSTGTLTINNINSNTVTNMSIVSDATAITMDASSFVSGGSSDEATLTFGNTSDKVSDIDVTTLTFDKVDVLNIVSDSDGTPSAADANSIGTLNATDLEKVVISGDETFSLTTGATTVPTEIDASAMTVNDTDGTNVNINTSASSIASILVKATAASDTINISNAATSSSTLYLGGGTDTVTVTDGTAAATSVVHTLEYTATALDSGDIQAGDASTVTMATPTAGDEIILDFTSNIESLLKSGGTTLGSSAADITISGTSLSANTNIAATQTATGMLIQIDVNGDGTYTAADDWQITLAGTGTDTLVYNASADHFIFTV